VIELMRCK